MKSTNAMKEAILNLFPDFKLEVGWHGKKEASEYMPLCVEIIEPNVVSIAHYYTQEGDLVPDPDVLFFVDPMGEWYPVSMKNAFGILRSANVAPDFRSVATRTPSRQRDLATFCNMWAKNIRSQYR
jgi:hypothetical protein